MDSDRMRLFALFMICLFCKKNLCEIQKELLDEELAKKFQFQLFENFDGCKGLYVQERKLVTKLLEVKQKLLKAKMNFRAVSKDRTKSRDMLLDLRRKISSTHNYLIEFSEVKNNKYPTQSDVQGSIKAMFILHYSYYLNMTAAVYDGKLSYKDHHGILKEYQAYEKLNIHDVVTLADETLKFQDYALAIDLTREVIPMLKQYEGKRNRNDSTKILLRHIKWMKKNLMKINNGYLEKEHAFLGMRHRTLTYIVNKNLKRKKKQPIFIASEDILNKVNYDSDLAIEWMWFRTCQIGKGKINSYYPGIEKLWKPCRLVHHQNPYLKLGPFKEEMYSIVPYSVVFHDILTDSEIDFLKKESSPNLSRNRTFDTSSGAFNIAEFKSGARRRIIHKSVQAWLSEVEWPSMKDIRKHYVKMINPILWKLNKRISLATQLVTNSKTSSTRMQVTNYGLAGLCEPHADPIGIETMSKKAIQETSTQVLYTGDKIATFMAWLADTDAGGGTAYIYPGHESLITPKKGAAAFWYNLKSDLTRDVTSYHAGCPVIKGNKWILNKWIYSYDNFRKFPCRLVNAKRYLPPSMMHYHKSYFNKML